MKKAACSFLSLTLALILFASSLVSCSAIQKIFHTHSYDYFHDDTTHWRVCRECGEKTETEPHALICEEHLDATCEKEGFDVFTCSDCGFRQTDFLTQTAHRFERSEQSDPAICAVCGRMESDLVELPQSERYGYRYLAALANSEIYLPVYRKLSASIAARKDAVALHQNLTKEELARIYFCVSCDHPEYFWLTSNYEYSYSGTEIREVTPSYYFSSSELASAKEKFSAAANEILAGLSSSMTDFEKELFIHDAIVKSNTYDESHKAPVNHSAYSALVLGCSVCDGYSKLFHYFMARAGILSVNLIGYSNELHSWDAVKLDGDWYMVDPTWDDPTGHGENTVQHTYFNCPWAQFASDHSFVEPGGEPIKNHFEIPSCTSDRYNYFTYFGYEGDLNLTNIDRVIRSQWKQGQTVNFQLCVSNLSGTPEERTAAIRAFFERESNLYPTVSKALGRRDSFSISYSVSPDGNILTLYID
ncbi:MAG: hypothetical protein IJR88_03930 [Clostridia bacterium]|nr:hypothetical protein [Clostridia bacterium]